MTDKDAEIEWYRSCVVTLLLLAQMEGPHRLTNSRVAAVCKHTLDKYPPRPAEA